MNTRKHTLFISDIHLQADTPKTTQWFVDFLQGPARKAEAVYILGDLFEVWIGDDDGLDFNEYIKSQLLALSSEVPVYFMPGNRDFLIGQRFIKDTGLHSLKDPSWIFLYGKRYLLMHGDSLCVDDPVFQRFRRLTHHRFYQRLFLSLPLRFRRFFANKARMKSQQHQDRLERDQMDVNVLEIERMMRQSKAQILIHGHTHRPGREKQRIVLGAWHQSPWVLAINEDNEIELFSQLKSTYS